MFFKYFVYILHMQPIIRQIYYHCHNARRETFNLIKKNTSKKEETQEKIQVTKGTTQEKKLKSNI